MAIFTREPSRALLLLDSARIIGNMSAETQQYLSSMIWYYSKGRPDTCITMCYALLDQKPWSDATDIKDPVIFETQIYELMATAAYTRHNHALMIECANKGISLAHGRPDLLSEECDLLGRAGRALLAMGEEEQAFEMYRKADSLIAGINTWECLVTHCNLSNRRVWALIESGNYEEAEVVTRQVLDRLTDFEQNPDKVTNQPKSIKDNPESRQDFIDDGLVRAYSCMARIYADRGDKTQAGIWVQRALTIHRTSNYVSMHNLFRPMIEIGMTQEVQKSIDELRQNTISADTLNYTYVELLITEAMLNDKLGHHQQAYLLQKNAYSIAQEVRKQENQEQLQDLATQYHLQDERLMRRDAQKEAQFWFITSIAIISLVLLCLTLYYAFVIHRRLKRSDEELTETNQTLNEVRIQMKAFDSEIEERQSGLSMAQIYKECIKVMSDITNISNPKFNLEMLAAQVASNRTYVSNAISLYSDKNFRTLLAYYRIEGVKRLLQENPDMRIEDLAHCVGIESRSSLYRQFENTTGESLRSYQKRLKAQLVR